MSEFSVHAEVHAVHQLVSPPVWMHRQECCVEAHDSGEMHHTVVDRLTELGYTVASSFTRLVQDWADTHAWSLAAMAKASIIAQRDQESMLNPPAIFVFEMETRKESLSNPALAFFVDHVGIMPLNTYLHEFGLDTAAYSNWHRAQPLREKQLKRYENDPDFIGVYPATFLVDRIITIITFYPLFRYSPAELRFMDGPGAVIKNFGDLYALGGRMIALGLPLRALDTSRPNAVVPGMLEKNTRGLWVWKPLFKEWSTYTPGARIDFDLAVTHELESGLPPQTLTAIIRVV